MFFRELKEPVYLEGKKVPFPTGFTPTLHEYRLSEPKKKKKSQTVFVCSMADLFGEWVPDHWIQSVFDACESAQWHQYLFLTKNPRRYLTLANEHKLPISPHIYYGTTVTELAQNFFAGPPFRTFVSIEPILEDFGYIRKLLCSGYERINWVIIGAETGNRKNKVVPEKGWIEPILEICERNNVPVFMKNSLIPIMGEENMRREFPWNNRGC